MRFYDRLIPVGWSHRRIQFGGIFEWKTRVLHDSARPINVNSEEEEEEEEVEDERKKSSNNIKVIKVEMYSV